MLNRKNSAGGGAKLCYTPQQLPEFKSKLRNMQKVNSRLFILWPKANAESHIAG
jgi:hypothetical protein